MALNRSRRSPSTGGRNYRPLLVQPVAAGGDLDLLVRVEDEDGARRAALEFLGGQGEVTHVGPVQVWRWVPANPSDTEHDRYLHPAYKLGHGAFRARIVTWSRLLSSTLPRRFRG